MAENLKNVKMDVLSRRKNPLLKREEIIVTVEHKGARTPSRLELLEDLSKKLKINKNLIIVDKILTVRGKSESKVKVLAYEKESDIPAYKLEKMKKRIKVKEEKKPEEESKEEGGEKAEEEKPEEEKSKEVGKSDQQLESESKEAEKKDETESEEKKESESQEEKNKNE